jgi:hypothetical protein
MVAGCARALMAIWVIFQKQICFLMSRVEISHCPNKKGPTIGAVGLKDSDIRASLS